AAVSGTMPRSVRPYQPTNPLQAVMMPPPSQFFFIVAWDVPVRRSNSGCVDMICPSRSGTAARTPFAIARMSAISPPPLPAFHLFRTKGPPRIRIRPAFFDRFGGRTASPALDHTLLSRFEDAVKRIVGAQDDGVYQAGAVCRAKRSFVRKVRSY